MIGLYVNNSTPEHFAFQIINGKKTIETRTKRAAKTFLSSGVKPGDRIAIVAGGHIQGYATFQGVKDYDSRAAFMEDYKAHRVRTGSKYDYTPEQGKAGIILSDPEFAPFEDYMKKVQRTAGYTYTVIKDR